MAESRFHSILKAKIHKIVGSRTEELSLGAPQDYESYRFQVGYLQGLRDILSLCEETEREFDQ
jgi:hypothetical protein